MRVKAKAPPGPPAPPPRSPQPHHTPGMMQSTEKSGAGFEDKTLGVCRIPTCLYFHGLCVCVWGGGLHATLLSSHKICFWPWVEVPIQFISSQIVPWGLFLPSDNSDL